MDKFDWSQFSKRIFINSDLETVYNSWTKSEELERWFLSKALFISKDAKEIIPSENVTSDCTYKWSWFAQNHYEEGNVVCENGIDYFEFTFEGLAKFRLDYQR